MAREHTITTQRLILLALSRQAIALLIAQRFDEVGPLLDIIIPAAWFQADVVEQLPHIATEMAALSEDERWVWVIVEAVSRTLIGDVGFHQPLIGNATLEIGYAVLPTYQHQGYATEAARALVAWAFAQPEPQRIIAEVLPDNAPSLKVARNLGMHEVDSSEPAYLRFALDRPR